LVSIPAAGLLYLALLLKIKFRTLLFVGLVFIGGLYSTKNEILIELQKNKQDSSEELVENFQSISNISTDDSNTERLNRWAAAISMLKERPIFGWGPGTYQFQYAPFQSSANITLISTNAGDLGNAHSEYISPLAETGIFGGILFGSIALYALYLGFSLVSQCNSVDVRLLTISTLLGLTTYLTHGFLNNYLDSEKAAVPFWAFLAILTSIDLYHKSKPKSDAVKP
jgi:putative inorganic carbon (HCO3(-)) transporter